MPALDKIRSFFFFNDTATPEIYTLSLHDALPIYALAARELHLGRPVEVAAELREGRQLTILSEVEPQLAGHLAHRLDLRRAAHPRDRQADVDRGPDAAVEEVRLEVDLPVGDGDDVRRDVRGHVAELGLDDRQRGQRATAERVVELRRALEQ